MAEKDMMPKINVERDFTPEQKVQLDYIKKLEKQNLERVQKLVKLRKRNIFTGILLGSAVLGIYIYSMAAVKQEKFLDELDE